MSNELQELQNLSKQRDTYGMIAAYFIANINIIPKLYINDVAKACYTSTATVVRMCKRLGYSGFVDFKLAFSEYLSQWDYDKEASCESGYIYENKNPSEIANIITQLTVNSIIESTKYIDSKNVSSIVDLLYQCDKIDFYGAGASNLIAQDFQYKFLRAGKNCTAYADQHIKFSQAQQSTENTVAFGISYSGETTETIQLLEIAKARGATIVTITNEKNNKVKDMADYSLIIKNIEKTDGYVVASSRITMLHIMDIIYSIYASSFSDIVSSNVAKSRPVFFNEVK